MPEQQSPANLYETAEQSGKPLGAEAQRLRDLDYPAERSIQAIGDVEGKTVLDAGAGNNQTLGRWVQEHGGTYTALDIRMDAAVDQQSYGALAAVGSIDHLPVAERSIHVSHARFVLGHFANETRRHQAIRELMRVASERAVLMDYDWAGWHGSQAMEAFKQVATEVATRRGFNPHYGSELKQECERLAPEGATVQEQRFQREPGAYHAEILGLASGMRQLVVADGDTELLARLDEAMEMVRAESTMDHPPAFTTPDIVAVTISR